MRVSCVIGCYGDPAWRDLAWSRAFQSATRQGFHDVTVRYLPTGTLAQARNEGAAEAEGDAYVFLDGDDELAPGYLAAFRPWLTPRGVVGPAGWDDDPEDLPPIIVGPAVSWVNEDGTVTVPQIPNYGGWPRVNEFVIGTLVSRALFEKVGGFEEWPSIEDYDLWLRCVDAGARTAHEPKAVYLAHRSASGRNLDQSCYPEIWRRHEERIGQTHHAYGAGGFTTP